VLVFIKFQDFCVLFAALRREQHCELQIIVRYDKKLITGQVERIKKLSSQNTPRASLKTYEVFETS